MAGTTPVLQKVAAQVVGNAFVQQYYHIQHQSPGLVHRFYQDNSKVGRPEDDGTMSITTTMDAINNKILSLNYGEYRAEIKSVDSQESHDGGVHVLVTGYLAGKDNLVQNFTQTFFLAPQEKGYFVLNDMFRYVEGIKLNVVNQSPLDDMVAPLPPEQDPSPTLENHVSVQTVVSAEVNEEEVLDPSDNEELAAMEEEPVAEVVDEEPDDSQMAVELEANSKIEEVPKKSYASIVMDKKDSAVPVSSPAPLAAPAPRRTVAKSQDQLVNPAQAAVSDAETPFSGSDALENDNNKEGEAFGYSIYIRGLPTNTTPAQLEDEFKRFGPIKNGGVQVRNKQQGLSFGFVEFEVANAVQEAIEASPITIGGRKAFVEEKRSTYTPGNNRGQFSTGGGSGFRNEGARGRGNYGSGRGYSRFDVNGRTEFGNRSSNRGGFSSRGANGYERANSMGSNGGNRSNRGGGMAVNGTAKTVVPRVSATA